MKNSVIAVLMVLLGSRIAMANVGGELIFVVNNPLKVTVTVTITQVALTDAWTWDQANSKVKYFPPSYSRTKSVTVNSQFAWDDPMGGRDASEGILPWGQMEVTISIAGANNPVVDRTFDFADENWSWNEVPYSGGDLDIDIDAALYTVIVRRTHKSLNDPTCSSIWEVWGLTDYSPVKTDFKPPIFLKNIVNGGNAGYTLHVGTETYSSDGDPALKDYHTLYSIGTNIERVPQTTNKHNNWNQTPSDYLLTRNVTITSANNLQYAYFFPLSATTLRNSLDGAVVTGISGGYILFVDPWYVDINGNQPGQPVQITSGSSPTGAYGQPSGGVFLNQVPNPNNPSVPYYSVQAQISQTINGHTAFFGGWSASPSNSVTFQNATTPTTALVFNSAGATVTTNYIYSVVASNATLQAGTYTFAGSLTINSGATLTLNSGTTLNFPSGASLVVNGALSANGVTFTQSTSNGWTGISLNHDGSSITNCTISYASSPLTITNVNTATISGCTINNSTFSSTQAILVSNSTPIITSMYINGLTGATNSSNGVRYTNGRGGTITESTIQNCGAGNGIIIQGNSIPTVSSCMITNNYYNGILVTANGPAVPLISYNTLTGNGTHGGTRQYPNLDFQSHSTGTVQSNTMSGSYAGVAAYSGSFPTAGSAQNGSNTITGNDYGLLSLDKGSSLSFGYYNVGKDQYDGTCNWIYGNAIYDAYAYGGGTGASIGAQYNWWGQSPPNTSKIYAATGSTIDYSHWLTTQSGCPYDGGGPLLVQGGGFLTTGVDTTGSTSQLYQRATNALFSKDYAVSSSLCQFILRSNASVAEKQSALVRLLTVFLQSGDTAIISDLKSYIVGTDSISQTAEELLANAYAATGSTSKAVSLANDLITKNPGTETEKRALLLLASLRAFDKNAESISASALRDVKTRFGSSLDQGLMAALTTANDISVANFSSNREAAQKVKGEVKVDNANTAVKEYSIENYPNPFNPTTTIAYQLPKDGRVTIKIFDAIGREVVTLVDEFKPSGRYTVQFDASHLASGIYFYSLKSGDYNAVKKMSLIK